MAITIKQIAELSGVSRGTVDRVLNNRGKVNPSTEKKIRELAEELGYMPNKAASALAIHKKNLVFGIIINSIGNIFFDEVLNGIKKAEKEFSVYEIKIITIKLKGYNPMDQLAAIDELISKNINGLILTPINTSDIRQKLLSLEELNIPIIALNSDIQDVPHVGYVGIDYFKSGEIAGGLMRLFHKTYCHVGIITGSFNSLGHNLRIEGFKSTIKNQFSHIKILDIIENNDDDKESFNNTLNLINKFPELNGIYLSAGGVEGACTAITQYANNPVTIICCDDIPIVKKLIKEKIISASICQQPFQQGYLSLKALFEYIVHNTYFDINSYKLENEIKILQNI
ncbi:hypothetical protein AN639_00585 [Candidatus Epulonipiscium fishelsonii]|uniref:Uncharacterized protein n=1 Tax=Candidatus Epulonipiscium fishelsonii TaxID=77094 RepID=A0ACC8XBH4_9FIRM|nr:hypothetical protein AN396_07245 [Epulopiscium sp. SCG-B11WGA-EpuloA1]ONI41297.1 hypothetical protein AN639_00585 [Epulopiscium sp. SCG-B05WGA-EpuloA1]ONI47864.1 hypothetical protein AN644_03615 [Epulopiscium sp. SCG-C06WGA-EpuloA1]